MNRKNLFFLFKIVFGFGLLLYLVLYIARPQEIIAVLRDVSWPMAALAFGLHAFGFLFSALRWKLILDEYGADFSIPRLTRSLLVGTFFNLFLPTRFGGDVMRVSDTRHIEHGATASLAVIVYERMSGIVALLVFALFASLLKIRFIKEHAFSLCLAPGQPAGHLPAGPGLEENSARIFGRLNCRRPWVRKILDKLDKFHGIILDFVNHRALTRKVFFWALLLQLNVVIHYFLIGQALHLGRIPLLDYFFSIPIMLFILSFPVSINGIGVRDLFLIEIFAQYGYPASLAIAFSLLDLAFNLLLGIAGGLIYIFRKK